ASVARTHGVQDRVHTTGFLDYSSFEAAIAACDLCINLRYPTAGETSASLLRVLALGRPAVVSDYAYGAELPDSVVVKVPLGDGEVAAIGSRVGALLEDRIALEEMSHSARKYVEAEHDPAQAARALVDACKAFRHLEPLGWQQPTVEAPSTLVWRQISAELVVEGSDPPWVEGRARVLNVRVVNHGPARWLATRSGAGGIMVKVHWRSDPWSDERNESWVELPHALGPGESYSWSIQTRRPPGASMLVVEPHVKEIAGFNSLGGPKWVRFL
ncbi:MAG: glycosyltransferase, partial [Acidobacteriota bacterium]